MIISFSVENFLSIHERQEISFVASNLKDNEEGIIKNDAFGEYRLLPALLIYGANAAGKSALIKAFDSMIDTVLLSQTEAHPDQRIPTRRRFLLDAKARERPTVFETDFICEGVHYNYGFALFEREVAKEWLFSYPHGSPRMLFERNRMKFSFGRHLKGQNKAISQLTRTNSLFLSAAAQSNHNQLTTIFKFFRSIHIETSLDLSGFEAKRRIKDEHHSIIDDQVIDFLKKINTGIVGHHIKDRQVSKEVLEFSKKMGLAMKPVIQELDPKLEFPLMDEIKAYKVVEFEHQDAGGGSVHFPLHWESSGTLRLLLALPKFLAAIETGSTVVMDELDLSLHTQAAEQLLRMFCSREHNPKGAQILTTTHDTNLLQSSCLRRDQVWFVSKDESGATQVYPLTDIHTRGSDNIERRYLQGRFGATPY